MGRHEPIRLRETSVPFASDAEIVDVEFTEIAGKRRSVWARIKSGLQALLWAATIGFLVPPAWVLVQTISAVFASF